MLGHRGAVEDVIYNRVRSTSFIAALPQPQQEQVIDRLRQLVAEEEELRGGTRSPCPIRPRRISPPRSDARIQNALA